MYRIELTKNLIWNCSSQINALISGNRGSGKSFFAIYLLTEIARHKGQLFIVDFKNSDLARLSCLLPQGRVASSKEEIFELLQRYVKFMNKRQNYINKNEKFGSTARNLRWPVMYLVYDEFGAFVPTLSSKERKEHDRLISQIALLGRATNVGIIAIMQQISVGNSGLPSNVREQFGLVSYMGNANEMALHQAFGNEIRLQNEHFDTAEGQLWLQGRTDGYTLPFCAPDLSNIDLWDELTKVMHSTQKDELLIPEK